MGCVCIWSICVCDRHITTYIQCMSVFTTNGVYVTSFGQCGNKEGDFNRPYYLYIDKCHFVYVSDTWND